MQGVYLKLDDDKRYLDLTIDTQQLEREIERTKMMALIEQQGFADLFKFEDTIRDAYRKANKAVKEGNRTVVTERIAEVRDAEFNFQTADSEMSATLTLTAAFGGTTPSVKKIVKHAQDFGIVRGLGKKHIQKLLDKVKTLEPGKRAHGVVAKGLPPKNGRDSRLQPLVPNALERVLKPQSSGANKVDMRNLGDVICVKAGTEVLKRLAPTKGRAGYTVTDTALSATAGEWLAFKPGDNTAVSDHDENILIAEIAGMPKFKDGNMTIDDTFTCNGVNVGTGNVNYDGAVLVNGDVTEKMIIVASGDVTINGFVESATIRAGGDIIITEGAMGKVNETSTEYSTRLVAQGSVHIQHGQGLEIRANGDVSIGRQLAYSKIVGNGALSVGPPENPTGNLFACEIIIQGAVRAGTLGAVSGSNLSIDFSQGFNTLLERKDSLDDLLKQLKQNTNRHKDRLDIIRGKFVPSDLQDKLQSAMELYRNEANLLNWMQQKVDEMRAAKDTYQEEMQLVARKRLYPGVTVKLNNRIWRAEREYNSAVVSYEDHQWQYKPFI